MSTTFTQLGIPFPLFGGPVEQASEYQGIEKCGVCRRADQHCFYLEVGGFFAVNCPICGCLNGAQATIPDPKVCPNCDNEIQAHSLRESNYVCYGCLRSGKAAITHDTEIGMISWDQALEGVTNGIPGLDHPDFEMVPIDDEWVGARLPQSIMYEMLRTPNYETIQGEQWLFCCAHPMTYVGRWNQKEVREFATDRDGERHFYEIVRDSLDGQWKFITEDSMGVYVFRCGKCSRYSAHYDVD